MRSIAKTQAHQSHNVAISQLNSVAKTVDCRQLVLRVIVNILTIHKTIYDSNNIFIVKLIKILQQEDNFAVRLRADKTTSIRKNDAEA